MSVNYINDYFLFIKNHTFMNDILDKYKEKIVSAKEAVRHAVKDGSHIVFGHAVAAPEAISKAIYDLRDEINDIEIFHMLYIAEAWHMRPELKGKVRIMSNFYDAATRVAHENGQADFVPCNFHEVPELLKKGFYRMDVAAVQVSYPDKDGYCSFGVSCDYTKTAAEIAQITIAEMNRQMPYIKGDNLIHISELDYIVKVDRPLFELKKTKITDVERAIGKVCSELIPDGATLQLGIGAIPDAVLLYLENRKDLGIHTEMFTDGVMEMIKKGVITGNKKTLHKHKVVSSLIMGSKELYDFINNNDVIEMYPVNYTNSPFIIGQNKNMVSINSCIEMDLMGQVASESISNKQFSGTGGQVDFLRGAKLSEGGISILAFPSTTNDCKISKIVTTLKEGSIVTDPRTEIDYVATEYGYVRLRGLSLKQRAMALISIAHPKFRYELTKYTESVFG